MLLIISKTCLARVYAWITLFSAVSAVFLLLVYRGWYRLGGDKHFHPPAPWRPEGIEEMPVAPIVGPPRKCMKVALWLFDVIVALSTLGLPAMMWRMYVKQAMFAFKWYCLVALPLALAAWLC